MLPARPTKGNNFCDSLFAPPDAVALLNEVHSRMKCFPLTHYIPVDSSTVICWTSLFVILAVSGLFFSFIALLMENVSKQCRPLSDAKLYRPGLHCFPMTISQVFR